MSVNLSNTNLSKAQLTTYFIYNMNFGDPILNDAIILNHWTEQLKERNNYGLNTMLEKYSIIGDSLTIKDSLIFKLTPKTM
jgi:hypothetical protein